MGTLTLSARIPAIPIRQALPIMIYTPNTFTPNGNGVNEFFFGKGRGIKEYDIWIFDRWGNLIWDCHYSGSNTGWDVKMMDGMSSACKWDGIVESGGADMNGRSGQ